MNFSMPPIERKSILIVTDCFETTKWMYNEFINIFPQKIITNIRSDARRGTIRVELVDSTTIDIYEGIYEGDTRGHRWDEGYIINPSVLMRSGRNDKEDFQSLKYECKNNLYYIEVDDGRGDDITKFCKQLSEKQVLVF